MTRANRSTADLDAARDLRADGLHQLRSALFYDASQSALFTDRETIALARLRHKDRAVLNAALANDDWDEVERMTDFLRELRDGLRLLDRAELIG